MKAEKYLITSSAQELLMDRKAMNQAFAAGKTLVEVLEWSDQQVEGLFLAARELLLKERFQEARDAFTFLATVDPLCARHWMGLGLANQQLEEWREALAALSCATLVDGKDPVPWYYIAQCQVVMHKRSSALLALEIASKLAAESPVYVELAARCRTALGRLTGGEGEAHG